MTFHPLPYTRRLLTISVLVALVVGVTSPVSAASLASSTVHNRIPASSTDTINILGPAPTAGFDPNIANQTASLVIMELMYDTLLDYNKTGQLVGDIAKNWTLSSNGLSYTFHLQPTAHFSNGSPITASDVQFSLARMAKGTALGSQLTDMTGTTVVNPTTLTVHLAHPSRVFLEGLAVWGSAAILDKQAVQSNSNYFAQPTDTSGAWSLVQYLQNQNLSMTANKYYWERGYPKIKNIAYTFTEDPVSAAEALQSGTADLYYPIDPQDAIHLHQSGKTNTYVFPSNGVVLWGLDKSIPPFNNVDVRLAIAYMSPRGAAFKTCWDGIGGAADYGNVIQPGQSFYTPGLNMFQVSPKVALVRAGALLDKAGWIMGSNGVRIAKNVPGVKNGTPFTYKVPFQNNYNQATCVVTLLQASEKPLGVNLVPESYDAATFYGQVAKNAFPIYQATDGWSTIDQEFETGFACTGQATDLIAKWCDPKADSLIAKAAATQNLQAVASIYHQVQVLIEQQQPAIVIGAQYSITSATTRLHGYYTRPDGSGRSLIYSYLTSS